jgi:hypothetical protein
MAVPADQDPPDIAREKLVLERRRVELQELVDSRRLDMEEKKNANEIRWGWTTRLGVLIPVFVAIVAFLQGSCVQRQQAENNFVLEKFKAQENLRLEELQANRDFEVKAAELVMAAEGPAEVRGRAEALGDLFPQRLGGEFSQGLVSKLFSQLREDESREAGRKKELLELLAANPQRMGRILGLWQQLYPEDKWAAQLEVRAARVSSLR